METSSKLKLFQTHHYFNFSKLVSVSKGTCGNFSEGKATQVQLESNTFHTIPFLNLKRKVKLEEGSHQCCVC